MTNEEIDLDAIEQRASEAEWGESHIALALVVEKDVPALIAEVRRLREGVALLTDDRDEFARILGIEPEWTESDTTTAEETR
ncbi:hypothetical protein EDF22_0626 [Rathayibacter sp. PhB127]|uniref:hypothetical protein n=1 Tax=Rathayibacter sp. PhB127 TaxID=2485176 RepID=UPI000F4C7CBA|nr:hypothetical protein [Rathayibacter sp. PhB127]ROS28895.1 hypothetical protein EDF22_0626 [Rathayibacter sp. PhB127]